MGQEIWPYQRSGHIIGGRLKFHDLRAVNERYTIHKSHAHFLKQLFSLMNNRNVDIMYSN